MNNNETTGKSSYTPREIAERNSVNISTVNRWIADKRLKSLKIGRLRRITWQQEQEFLNSHLDVREEPPSIH